ncbi:MAG: 50S ribosomal protein L11 methyltransferase [Anaerolineae bacterium]
MSKWIEVTLRVDGEAAEAAAEVLNRYGYQGVSIEVEGIPPDTLDDGETPPPGLLALRAYLPEDARAPEAVRQLIDALGYMNMMYPMPEPEFRTVDEQDWAEAWKAHYQPVRIGRRLLIRPLWIEMELAPDDLEIALDPGMAFGTGTHPTTQLCLEVLEDIVTPGVTVLDLGCGSGILAIGAAKLGAESIWAIDIDPIAVDVTIENAQQNRVLDQITAEEGSLETALQSGRQFDILAANILARVIIGMCEQGLGEVLRPGGLAVFSGIIAEQADDVEVALRQTGLEPTGRRQLGDWIAIEARR